MPNKKQRMQNRETYNQLMHRLSTPRRYCSNCKQNLGKQSGHFVPPSLGEEGFFYCEAP